MCAVPGWTDVGASREEFGLRHRAASETRSIPVPPVLVAMLRAHIARYGSSPGGYPCRTARGGPLNDTGWGEVWQRARPVALTRAQQASPWPAAPTIGKSGPLYLTLRMGSVRIWFKSGTADLDDISKRWMTASCQSCSRASQRRWRISRVMWV